MNIFNDNSGAEWRAVRDSFRTLRSIGDVLERTKNDLLPSPPPETAFEYRLPPMEIDYARAPWDEVSHDGIDELEIHLIQHIFNLCVFNRKYRLPEYLHENFWWCGQTDAQIQRDFRAPKNMIYNALNYLVGKRRVVRMANPTEWNFRYIYTLPHTALCVSSPDPFPMP